MAQISDDLVLGVVARRLDLVSPESLKQAVGLRSDDPTRTLDVILGEMGLLAEEVRRALAELTKSLRNKVSESLLSEARALDMSRQAASPQPDNLVSNAGTLDGGEAGDTIDPFAPPPTGPLETGSATSDPLGSTADAAPSTILCDKEEEDETSSWESVGTGASPREAAPPTFLVAEQRYRLIRQIAQGIGGKVFLARDEIFGREVELKHLTDLDQNASMQDRFLREARITGNLEHPGVGGVYAIGRDPGGRPFYVMRLVRGETLSVAIRRYHSSERMMQSAGARALALRKLINRLVAACNAVAFTHSRGVLHGDIKPDNIMIGEFGETLVVDWGLAKRIDKFVASEEQSLAQLDLDHHDSTTKVESGRVVGTAPYMSPEQAEGRQDLMQPTSDVYSLGATLYEILTGEVPILGKKLAEVLLAVRKGQFPPPSEVIPAIDPALEAICLMAMAHAPEDRYVTARAMADDLERWLADEPVAAYRESVTKALSRWLSRHPHVLIRGLIAMVAFLLVALSGIVLPRLWK